MKPQVTFSFTRLPDAGLITKALFVTDSMTNNAAFPEPDPAIPDVIALNTAFQKAVVAMEDGGKRRTVKKNEAREALLDALRSLATWVQGHCDNNLAILLSSGFDARKAPERAGILPAPQFLTLTNTAISGEVSTRAGSVENARSFELQSCTDPANDPDWQHLGTFSSTRATIGGLTPGKIVWMRLRAIGSAGPGAWSEPASVMVS